VNRFTDDFIGSATTQAGDVLRPPAPAAGAAAVPGQVLLLSRLRGRQRPRHRRDHRR
jgi:hypothetical protein